MNYFRMVGGILILLVTGFIAFSMIDSLRKKFPFLEAKVLRQVYFYHLFLSIVYYLYALFNASDSVAYYRKITENYRGEDWFSFYGTSTTFIEFVGYPFIKFFGFSYEAMMALFAFFGFVGFLYFYVFFKENIRFKHQFLGFNLLTLVFFLPNLHFWSASFGKGSAIFMGLGIFFFGLSKVSKRWIALLIGGLIIYHVRPHIMLVVLVSSAIGFMFSTKGVSLSIRLVFLAGAAIAFFYIYSDVLTMVGIDEEEFVSEGLDLTHRASELSKSDSGVDIVSYSLPMQVFTFLFRPLFVDAPGMLGLIVSFENVFYLLIVFKILSLKGINFLFTGNFLLKTAFFSFLTVSVALAQISGNLGLAMRQKSQVMILLLFVVLSFMDSEKMKAYRASVLSRMRLQKLAKLQEREN